MSKPALPEECDCTCHSSPEAEVESHAMPCCMTCTHCGARIEVAFWVEHSDACKKGERSSAA